VVSTSNARTLEVDNDLMTIPIVFGGEAEHISSCCSPLCKCCGNFAFREVGSEFHVRAC
jgi:hypothetical protein